VNASILASRQAASKIILLDFIEKPFLQHRPAGAEELCPALRETGGSDIQFPGKGFQVFTSQ
jgi:hypothetical protein